MCNSETMRFISAPKAIGKKKQQRRRRLTTTSGLKSYLRILLLLLSFVFVITYFILYGFFGYLAIFFFCFASFEAFGIRFVLKENQERKIVSNELRIQWTTNNIN